LKYTNVFWDWNGTLIDDVDLSMAASNSTFIKRNKEPITKAQYYEYIETPIIKFYEHILDFKDITIDEIVIEFNEYYNQNLSESPLMQGAKAVLQELDDKGLTQIILSSSSNEMLLPFVEKFGVKNYFKHILGSSDFYCTGKTERAMKFIGDNNINPKSCVLIGDTLHDYDTACAIGCDCILIPKGHQSRTDLEATGAIVADDISFIPNLLF